MTFDQWWTEYEKQAGNEVLSEYEKDVARDAWNASAGGPATDSDVEAVETAVGLGHGAWDCAPPKAIIEAARATGMEKLLRDMLDRAYKMMQMAGYRVVEQNPDHNNPIIAWMADARHVLYGSGPQPRVPE